MQTVQKTITHDEVAIHCESLHWFIAGLMHCTTIGQCENTATIGSLAIQRSWSLTLTEEQTALLEDYIQRQIKQYNVVVSTYKCTSGLFPFTATRLTFTKK